MATKYVIAAGGNWNDDTTWSTTSGGANDTTKPTASDDVFIDGASGNVVINGSPVCRSLNCAGYTGILSGSSNIVIGDAGLGAGNVLIKLVAGMTFSYTGNISINSTNGTQQTIETAGKTLGNLTISPFNAVQPNILLSDNLTCGAFLKNGGIFNTNNKDITCTSFLIVSGSSVTLGSSIVTLTGTSGTIWRGDGSTLNAGTSTIVIASISASSRTFAGGGKTYNKLTYDLAGSTGALVVTGANTFNDEFKFLDASNARTLTLPSGSTQVITTPNIQGTSGKLMTIQSSTPGSPATISKTSGIWSSDYLSIKDITATGGADFYAGHNSTDVSGNTGWLFNSYLTLVLSDSITLTETFSKGFPPKVILDTVVFVEALQKQIGKEYNENISLTETLQKQTAKVLSESITLTETLKKSIARTLTDTVTLVESLKKAIAKTFYAQSGQAYLLLEQGGYLLQEDGSKIIIEGGAVVYGETFTKQTSKTFTAVITLVEFFVIPLVRKFRRFKTYLRQSRKHTTNLK